MTKRLLIATVVCTLAALTIAVPADAYFTSHGSGTGSANVATLGSPAPVTALATTPAGSVVVTWSGVPGPDGQPISGYFVTEYNGTTVSPACSSSPKVLLDAGDSTPTLSCTDSGLAGGTYVYTVTAVFASWTSAATSGSVIVPATDTVTFDANDGSGSTYDETYSSGVAQDLTPNAFTYAGYTFNDWCTTQTCSDGGITYTDGESITISASMTLYAQWTAVVPTTYTVTYNGNGNTGGSVPVDGSSPYSSGATVTVLANTGSLVDTGYAFNGWNTQSGGGGTAYQPTATFSMPAANVTLSAQWTAVVPTTYTVTFDANGGSGTMADETYTSGVAQALTGNAFTYTGHTFTGWATTLTGAIAYTNGESITISASVTLYAQWKAVVPTGGPPIAVIIQKAPFGAAVTTTGSAAFTGTLATNGSGVTFKVTSPNAHLAVSSSGKVTTTGPLAVGTYSISGTDADTAGGSGYWGFTLSVTATSTAVGGPPIVVKVVPEVVLVAYTPWTLFAHQEVRLRVHLYGRRGTVSGIVKLEFRGQTLCAPKLTRGVGHCTVSSTKIGRGRHYLLVKYAGSGFYKPLKRRVNVYVHDTVVFS
jgi:uncharacterized repeat protein (TIGR02543 family)